MSTCQFSFWNVIRSLSAYRGLLTAVLHEPRERMRVAHRVARRRQLRFSPKVQRDTPSRSTLHNSR